MRRRHVRGAVLVAVTALLVGVTITSTPALADLPVGLERFYSQRLDWKDCGAPDLAECADVTVPLDYGDPGGRTITVAISRVPATSLERRRGVLLTNPGGPGEPGLEFPRALRSAMTAPVRAGYDLIGMDPRGVGRSSGIDCGWPVGFGVEAAGADVVSYARSVARQAELAARCWTRHRDLLPHISTRNTARDMDIVRAALGEPDISYLGLSYGTYLGAVYAQLFPGHIDRMVLDSALDPRAYGAIALQADRGEPNEAAFGRWAEWAAAHDAEYGLGTTREAVRALVEGLLQRAARTPIPFGPFLIDDHTLPVMLFMALGDYRRYPDLATQVRQLVDGANGASVEPDPRVRQQLALILTAQPHDLSALTAITCGDAPAPRDPAEYWRGIEQSRAAQPIFGPLFGNINPCAFWPSPREPATAVANAVPALIIQADGDTRTTYAGAVSMHQALTASRLLTLRDTVVHGLFGNIANRCIDAWVNAYLAEGALPPAESSCDPD
ncbi:alpha/beta fold hydrolase [Nocardia yamanashiensis]|uniref:alpha/beta fold hydrolase n=1 Tax=Nocardia yamanashiensis TaxID=209247 RepID=UPI000834DD00|nr:alpha/beta fold hydrolase [Nocardia yamanashiensis]